MFATSDKPRRKAPLLLLLLFLAPAPGAANEKSISLYSEGLVQLERGNLELASSLMDRAVAADPSDPYALYYRAIARRRLQDIESAVDDLQAAIDLKPDFPEAHLDLGVVLLEVGEHERAEANLLAAGSDPSLRGDSLLFLGIAKLRQGENAAALADLEQVAPIAPELATTALYYQGVAQIRLGRRDDARRSFEGVIEQKPGSQLANEASEFLTAVDSGKAVAKSFELYAGYGIEYDSNVVLRLDDESINDLGVDDDSDVVFNLRFGGRYSLWRGENTAVSIGYDFFQRLYVELSEYNLQGHRPNLHWTGRWDDLRFGVIAEYEFYLLETDAYLQRASGQPWIAWQWGDWGRSELSYRLRWIDFLDPPPGGTPSPGLGGDFTNSEDALDALSHQPRIRQYFYIDGPERYVALSYLYEKRDPTRSEGDPFEYDAHGVEIAGGTPIAFGIDLYASYSYRREDYQEGDRLDQPHIIVAALRWPLAKWFAISLGYFGELHNSNEFEYDRHVGSIGFDVAY